VSWSEANGLVTYTLNRPKALNALNFDQVCHIEKEIRVLRQNSDFSGILFVGAGEKAFCAGGDVLHINASAKDISSDWNRRWFSNEFLLNYFLSTLTVPVISVWKGIVMGGGVGLSIYGSHRIATDNTMFAMPETSIGFFPDVGGSWFLSHLVKPKGLGLFLGMTGHRLKGADALHVGLATHYVSQSRIPDLISALETSKKLPSTVNLFHETPPPSTLSKEFLDSVEKYFDASNSFEAFWDKLKAGKDDFAISAVKLIRSKCPLTVRVWFESYKKGSKEVSLKDALAREYKMCIHVTETDTYNFQEGVRATLIDKSQPAKYNPESIEDVTEEMVSRILEATEGGDLKKCMDEDKLMY